MRQRPNPAALLLAAVACNVFGNAFAAQYTKIETTGRCAHQGVTLKYFCESLEPPSLKRKNKALNDMSNGKATGPDKVPAEVYKHSPAAKAMLFDLVDKIFVNETIPDGMATGEFIMMFNYKPKKPDNNDPKSYRALCMLN